MSPAADRVPNLGAITVCVMLATIMQALDITIANVALPYMQGSLAASQDQINWVLTSYIVAAAIMTPPTGWLEGRFGRKRLFMISVAGFTVASVLCGIAGSLPEMVIFRSAQGLFGAALVPLSQAVLLDSYPREKQGAAMALWGVGVMVGPILGPTLGGWLTENYGWRYVFYINVPVGALTLLGMWLFMADLPRRLRVGLDWTGFVTLSLAIGALQVMLDRGEQLDWFGSREILAEAAVTGLAFYLFLVHTATSERPFVNPVLFRDRNLSVGLLLIFVMGILLFATLSLLTPFLQSLLDYPVSTAGLVMAPRGVGTMVAMFIAGRIMGLIDIRLILACGFALTALALHQMSGFSPDVDASRIIVAGLIQGVGLGFLFVPLSTITFATLAPQFRTEGTALFSLMRNIGSSVGISVMASLVVSNTQVNHEEIAAYVTRVNHLFHVPAIAHMWNPTTPAGRAALDTVVTQQATLIAYIDDFWLMMILSLAAIPLVFLLRRPRRPAAADAAAQSR